MVAASLGWFFISNSPLAQTQPSTSAAVPSAATSSETIVVIGTFAPAPETEINRSITIINFSQQDLLYKNWVDSLALVPSIDLRQRAANDIQGDLSIRGSSFGLWFFWMACAWTNVQTGHHGMDLPLPSGSVARIEVLRGAGSTLYGADAMAGSANIITTTPLPPLPNKPICG